MFFPQNGKPEIIAFSMTWRQSKFGTGFFSHIGAKPLAATPDGAEGNADGRVLIYNSRF
ncbi:MAG: hypothetical protein JWP38_3519 [Herbaspirillum sp.]|jgi:hypothetical protein|nr:hypothetical protein [Herbaspirillum sp.]